jgi:hypothetical protein
MHEKQVTHVLSGWNELDSGCARRRFGWYKYLAFSILQPEAKQENAV